MDAVALTSVIVSGAITLLVGGGGIVFAVRNSDKEREHRTESDSAAREHERKLAQASRTYDRRATAYEGLIEMLEREMLEIDRTNPKLSPAPPPPEPLTDNDYLRLEARAATFGSNEILDALRAFKDEARKFYANSRVYTNLKESRQFDETITTKMLAARDRAHDRLLDLEAQVRDELTSL